MKLSFKAIDFEAIAKVKSPQKFYLYCIVVGVLSGLAAVAFTKVLSLLDTYIMHSWVNLDMGYASGEAPKDNTTITGGYIWYWLLLLPIVGHTLSAILVHYVDESAKGAGADALLADYYENGAITRVRTPVVKFFATIFTLASAGSGGKQGPISQIGSGIGSLLARYTKLGDKARRSLFLAGMAGALGAIFRAPLGAALTAVEVLYKEDYESDSLIACIISSISGYFVFTIFMGFDRIFDFPEHTFINWYEIIFYIILGFVAFVFGFIFIKVFNFFQEMFESLKIHFISRAAIGGLLVGIIGLLSYESIGTGFGFIQKLIHGQLGFDDSLLSKVIFGSSTQFEFLPVIFFLSAIVVLRILSTSFTIGSGASGGVFGPSFFIGGTLGAIVGIIAHRLYPEIVPSYVPYIVVGMGGFFAGVVNAPIAAVIMACELTGSYGLLAPLMAVAIIAIIFSKRFSIYKNQRVNKFDSPVHHWYITKSFLKDIHVKSAMSKVRVDNVLDETITFNKMLKISEKHHRSDFILIDKNSEYKGIFSTRHLTTRQLHKMEAANVKLTEIKHLQTPVLRSTDILTQALEIFLNWDVDRIAVVNAKGKVSGFLTFRDILRSYHRKVDKVDSPLSGEAQVVVKKPR